MSGVGDSPVTEPVRVLQLVSLATGAGDRRGASGPEIRTLESLPFWDSAQVQIHVAYGAAGRLWQDFKKWPYWHDFVVTRLRRVRTFFELKALLERERIAVVHTQGPVYTDFVAALAARWLGIGCIITRAVQISEMNCSRIKRLAFYVLDSFTKRACSQMVAISQGGQALLVQEGCEKRNLTLVYNGVNLQKFAPAALSAENLREANSFRLGMFAQMVPHKRHDVLLRAMRILLDRGLQVRLTLAGDGPELPNLKDLAKRLRLENSVEFLGFQRELAEVYRAVDVVVLVSEREGLPVTLIEGMACGRTCVASNVAAVREVIEAGVSGMLVEENTPEAFAEVLSQLGASRARCREMGLAGRRIAEAKFGIEAMVSGYQDLYVKFAARR